jgi:sensor histidine kinase YesM
VFLKKYFQDKNLGKYLIRIASLILVAIGINILLNRYVNYGVAPRKEVFLFPSFGLHMALFVFYTAISVAYMFILEWYKNEKLRGEIAEEKLKTELDFLKSQINPHFLFNTLNNLFSISQKYKARQLSSGINELSNLMRYMLYESNAEFVSLKKEIKNIESFITIQQLRHEEEDELIINFEKKGDLNKAVIAPMILLPFVENAFKHGFSLSESSIINLRLETT